ncbi:MAG TPA: hypothetical protein VM223_01130 [Planctomycetota bacterium]|nr:hypothetical protein [Planctomycetota bacterium]
MAYAENTSVPVDRSKAEIERVLARYGATGFMYGIRPEKAVVAFEANDRHVRFILPMPDPSAPEFRTTPTGRSRKGDAVNSAFEQEVRRRWRALALAIKAKLEAVDTGITEFEDEFMAHIVMPDGKTVSEHTRPLIAAAYETGRVQPLLPGY